jgi:hypothetical protein
MKTKKTPLRMCVVCRTALDKRELLRLVRLPNGEVAYDSTGKISGRGAYLCKNKACVEKALKGKQLARALDCEIGAEDLLALKEALYDIIGE